MRIVDAQAASNSRNACLVVAADQRRFQSEPPQRFESVDRVRAQRIVEIESRDDPLTDPEEDMRRRAVIGCHRCADEFGIADAPFAAVDLAADALTDDDRLVGYARQFVRHGECAG